MSTVRPFATLIVISALWGCGASGPSAADAKAQADAQKAEEEKKQKADEAIAKRRAEREAKEKETKEADAKAKAALEQVAVLPAKLPKNLDKACKEVGEAQEAFMKRHFEGEALANFEKAKGTQIPMTVMQCNKAGSVRVAACQKNALDTAGPELKKEVSGILRACIEKFGEQASAADAKVPLKRPS